MDVKEYLGNEVVYEETGQQIWSKMNSDPTLVLDIRCWGRLQYLFETEGKAANFQDEIGRFIAEAINEKLNRYRPSNLTKVVIERVPNSNKISGYTYDTPDTMNAQGDSLEEVKEDLEDLRQEYVELWQACNNSAKANYYKSLKFQYVSSDA